MANTSPNATTLNSLPPEVLEKICRELLALPLEGEERKHIGCRTVAVLARTSRLLQEPALNTLWHTIPSLAVLFFTLPTAVYKRTQDKRSVRRFEKPAMVFASLFLRASAFEYELTPMRVVTELQARP